MHTLLRELKLQLNLFAWENHFIVNQAYNSSSYSSPPPTQIGGGPFAV